VKRALIAAAALFALAGPAFAVNPDEELADPKLEARAQALSKELRCVVCQNQSIDESEAPLAHDLRVILRERIAAGDTDEQAKAFLVQRYGHFVLLKPPMEGATLFLWFGPAALLAAGAAGVALYLRGRAKAAPPSLTPAEEAEVARLLSPDEAL
jgi:cytochrome c-type biogenesis protein CcmH